MVARVTRGRLEDGDPRFWTEEEPHEEGGRPIQAFPGRGPRGKEDAKDSECSDTVVHSIPSDQQFECGGSDR